MLDIIIVDIFECLTKYSEAQDMPMSIDGKSMTWCGMSQTHPTVTILSAVAKNTRVQGSPITLPASSSTMATNCHLPWNVITLWADILTDEENKIKIMEQNHHHVYCLDSSWKIVCGHCGSQTPIWPLMWANLVLIRTHLVSLHLLCEALRWQTMQ